MEIDPERKWDRAAARFDSVSARGPERRWAPIKRELFGRMGAGRILFVAVGTGLDFAAFPPRRDIVGIDISGRMLDKARPRAEAYDGRLTLRKLDVHALDYPDGSFDQVFTSCTFCSVPRPVEGLMRLRDCMKPGGELHMFEHTGSRHFPFGLMLDLMTPVSRLTGPALNRPTVENVRAAGLEVREVRNHFLDVVKTIHAVRPRARTRRPPSPDD